MNICFTVNKKFSQHLSVVLTTIALTNKKKNINCFILNDGLTTIDKFLLRLTVLRTKITLHFFDDTGLEKINFKVDRHASKANYFRLFMAEILPNDIDKVIYLDCDLLVSKSLIPLWNTDIEDVAIGAVNLPNDERIRALDLKPSQYVNSGVLVVNLKYWRKHLIQKKLIQYLIENNDKIKFWDQDAINACLINEIKFIDPIWNHVSSNPPKDETAIVHFVGKHKPWSIHFPHNQRKLMYYKALGKSPYLLKNLITYLKIRYLTNVNTLPY